MEASNSTHPSSSSSSSSEDEEELLEELMRNLDDHDTTNSPWAHFGLHKEPYVFFETRSAEGMYTYDITDVLLDHAQFGHHGETEPWIMCNRKNAALLGEVLEKEDIWHYRVDNEIVITLTACKKPYTLSFIENTSGNTLTIMVSSLLEIVRTLETTFFQWSNFFIRCYYRDWQAVFDAVSLRVKWAYVDVEGEDLVVHRTQDIQSTITSIASAVARPVISSPQRRPTSRKGKEKEEVKGKGKRRGQASTSQGSHHHQRRDLTGITIDASIPQDGQLVKRTEPLQGIPILMPARPTGRGTNIVHQAPFYFVDDKQRSSGFTSIEGVIRCAVDFRTSNYYIGQPGQYITSSYVPIRNLAPALRAENVWHFAVNEHRNEIELTRPVKPLTARQNHNTVALTKLDEVRAFLTFQSNWKKTTLFCPANYDMVDISSKLNDPPTYTAYVANEPPSRVAAVHITRHRRPRKAPRRREENLTDNASSSSDGSQRLAKRGLSAKPFEKRSGESSYISFDEPDGLARLNDPSAQMQAPYYFQDDRNLLAGSATVEGVMNLATKYRTSKGYHGQTGQFVISTIRPVTSLIPAMKAENVWQFTVQDYHRIALIGPVKPFTIRQHKITLAVAHFNEVKSHVFDMGGRWSKMTIFCHAAAVDLFEVANQLNQPPIYRAYVAPDLPSDVLAVHVLRYSVPRRPRTRYFVSGDDASSSSAAAAESDSNHFLEKRMLMEERHPATFSYQFVYQKGHQTPFDNLDQVVSHAADYRISRGYDGQSACAILCGELDGAKVKTALEEKKVWKVRLVSGMRVSLDSPLLRFTLKGAEDGSIQPLDKINDVKIAIAQGLLDNAALVVVCPAGYSTEDAAIKLDNYPHWYAVAFKDRETRQDVVRVGTSLMPGSMFESEGKFKRPIVSTEKGKKKKKKGESSSSALHLAKRMEAGEPSHLGEDDEAARRREEVARGKQPINVEDDEGHPPTKKPLSRYVFSCPFEKWNYETNNLDALMQHLRDYRFRADFSSVNTPMRIDCNADDAQTVLAHIRAQKLWVAGVPRLSYSVVTISRPEVALTMKWKEVVDVRTGQRELKVEAFEHAYEILTTLNRVRPAKAIIVMTGQRSARGTARALQQQGWPAELQRNPISKKMDVIVGDPSADDLEDDEPEQAQPQQGIFLEHAQPPPPPPHHHHHLATPPSQPTFLELLTSPSSGSGWSQTEHFITEAQAQALGLRRNPHRRARPPAREESPPLTEFVLVAPSLHGEQTIIHSPDVEALRNALENYRIQEEYFGQRGQYIVCPTGSASSTVEYLQGRVQWELAVHDATTDNRIDLVRPLEPYTIKFNNGLSIAVRDRKLLHLRITEQQESTWDYGFIYYHGADRPRWVEVKQTIDLRYVPRVHRIKSVYMLAFLNPNSALIRVHRIPHWEPGELRHSGQVEALRSQFPAMFAAIADIDAAQQDSDNNDDDEDNSNSSDVSSEEHGGAPSRRWREMYAGEGAIRRQRPGRGRGRRPGRPPGRGRGGAGSSAQG